MKVAPDGIPGYLEGFSAVLQPEYEQSIELGIKFFAEGRPPKTGKITLTFQTVFDTFTDGQDIYYDATDVSQDIMAISRPFRSKSARVVHEWVRKNSNYQTINYRKVSHRGGMYQLIAVDRGPTRIIADIDKDGFIDYDLIGVPGTSVTTRMVPRQRLRTKNWRPPITEITTPNGHRYRMIGPSAGPLGPSAGP